MGRRSRRRGAEQLAAPETPYEDAEGNVLVLRGAMTPATRSQYAQVRAGGLDQEDAWQRSVEFLFERLAVSWTIAGAEPIERQKELLARYRFASGAERTWIRGVLREHLTEWFPDVEAPRRSSTCPSRPGRALPSPCRLRSSTRTTRRPRR